MPGMSQVTYRSLSPLLVRLAVVLSLLPLLAACRGMVYDDPEGEGCRGGIAPVRIVAEISDYSGLGESSRLRSLEVVGKDTKGGESL